MIAEAALCIPKINAESALQISTAAADAWQTLIISMEQLMILMI